ncbi:MAG: ExbD/TolR family protein [Erythrobacter sp.]|uniref:ExbD/TolR family protein n=1 Tax=Erythrobacter sp. HL-111 TaxID=1798193 RepID=UPI0006D9EB92|nr:biopolymer transporter ExbD [Erythrobacter sp. HL-111]KPP83398.1 MAG: TolA energization system membrane component TolR [Erythrobacteraceae bacterium HL-111]SDS40911.1 Cell division and transport-associated protein TolR [Erythrobacter sp. HL-111]
MGASLSPSSHGKGRRRSRRAAMAEINVTPLVDVMLVLLIIFMVTVTLPAVGVPIELPESRASPVEEVPDTVTVSIDGEGRIYLENDPVPAGGFPEALATIDRGGDGALPTLVLRGDRGLDYGRVMAVMGEMNRAGFTRIELVTDGSVTPP